MPTMTASLMLSGTSLRMTPRRRITASAATRAAATAHAARATSMETFCSLICARGHEREAATPQSQLVCIREPLTSLKTKKALSPIPGMMGIGRFPKRPIIMEANALVVAVALTTVAAFKPERSSGTAQAIVWS